MPEILKTRSHSITDNTILSRRLVLAGSAGFFLSAMLPASAFALSESTAVSLIEKVVADIQIIINSGKPEAQMLIDFENKIFVGYAEVSLIAKTALGAPGRSASSSQLSAYIKAFQGYVSRKYGRQFKKFEGAVVEIKNSVEVGNNRGILVRTTNHLKGMAPFEVEWWVIEVGGRAKFFDLKIEGISMLSSERTEITAILESFNGDISKLTAYLNNY